MTQSCVWFQHYPPIPCRCLKGSAEQQSRAMQSQITVLYGHVLSLECRKILALLCKWSSLVGVAPWSLSKERVLAPPAACACLTEGTTHSWSPQPWSWQSNEMVLFKLISAVALAGVLGRVFEVRKDLVVIWGVGMLVFMSQLCDFTATYICCTLLAAEIIYRIKSSRNWIVAERRMCSKLWKSISNFLCPFRITFRWKHGFRINGWNLSVAKRRASGRKKGCIYHRWVNFPTTTSHSSSSLKGEVYHVQPANSNNAQDSILPSQSYFS